MSLGPLLPLRDEAPRKRGADQKRDALPRTDRNTLAQARTPDRVSEPTLASAWHATSGGAIADELLDWPPDIFALTNVILARSEAFRFAISPIQDWPPEGYPDWGRMVEEEALRWGAWVEHRRGPLPELLAQEWAALKERADVPLEHLAQRLDWRLCVALLTLHAMADEACAGLGVALDTSDAVASVYRARGRELLVRTGSIARIDPRVLKVLPKVRTPPTGRPAFSRYACVQGPGIEARWHKMPARHRGTDLRSEYATLLLLPWPLEVNASDFRPIEGSVQRPKDPFGFFEFAPAQGLDLELLDRVLVAARRESGSVDVVCLPESAVEEGQIGELEALLHDHGVISLVAGARQQSPEPGRAPSNWLHIGFNPRLVKGGSLPTEPSPPWFHIRQHKHHRWSLDEAQIYQYHLGGVLHPHVRWWESMEVPRRSIQFVEVAELTLAALVCEDLAQNDDVAELIRQVGPTIVLTALLDGPQLNSRWAARYASVLADDPGSAVMTLTSYGMVQRSRPRGLKASPVIALWKDPSRGVREIPLETGAHGVLLTVCTDRATRRSADGRVTIDNGTSCFDVAVHQISASHTGSRSPRPPVAQTAPHVLELEDLSVLTAWAEAVVEAVSHAPKRTGQVLADGRPGAPWRAAMGLPEPSGRLGAAIELMAQVVGALDVADGESTSDVLLAADAQDPPDEAPLHGLVRRVLLAMLEERRARQRDSADIRDASAATLPSTRNGGRVRTPLT
jgi:hypothetical protein